MVCFVTCVIYLSSLELISTLLDKFPHYYYRPQGLRAEGGSMSNKVEKLVMELMIISMNTEVCRWFFFFPFSDVFILFSGNLIRFNF
jgi:hypothetical protein